MIGQIFVNLTMATLPLLVASADYSASAGQAVVTRESFTVYHPVTPADLVVDMRGSCGGHRFGMTITNAHENLRDRLQSVRVDGMEIAHRVHAALLPQFLEDTVVMTAKFDRCTAIGPPMIRLRSQVIERSDPESMRFIDAWIDAEGDVLITEVGQLPNG